MKKNIILSFVLLCITTIHASAQHLGVVADKSNNIELKVDLMSGSKDPKKVQVNKMIVLKVENLVRGAKEKNVELLEFDARMPEHNHGMIVKPKISQMKKGEWKVEGVKFHMGGHWELSFKVKVDNQSHTLKKGIYL